MSVPLSGVSVPFHLSDPFIYTVEICISSSYKEAPTSVLLEHQSGFAIKSDTLRCVFNVQCEKCTTKKRLQLKKKRKGKKWGGSVNVAADEMKCRHPGYVHNLE